MRGNANQEAANLKRDDRAGGMPPEAIPGRPRGPIHTGLVEQHLNESGLADRLRLSVRTLQRWRWKGRGPPYLKLGGRVVYRLEDVKAWERRNRKLTSDDAGHS